MTFFVFLFSIIILKAQEPEGEPVYPTYVNCKRLVNGNTRINVGIAEGYTLRVHITSCIGSYTCIIATQEVRSYGGAANLSFILALNACRQYYVEVERVSALTWTPALFTPCEENGPVLGSGGGLFASDVKKQSDNLLKFYPNPANTQLTVTSDIEVQEIRIVSLEGKVIEQFILPSKTIIFDLLKFPNGIYILQITNKNTVSSRKFIVQH